MKVSRARYLSYKYYDTVSKHLQQAQTLGFAGAIFSCKNNIVEFIQYSNDLEGDLWEIHLNNLDKLDDNYFGIEKNDLGIQEPYELDNEISKTIEYHLYDKTKLGFTVNLQ